MDTDKKTELIKTFDIVSLPDSVDNPHGPATVYKIPKNLVQAYIKMTRELRMQQEDLMKRIVAEALRADPRGMLTAAFAGADDPPPSMIEVLAREDVQRALDTMTTVAIIHYREWWGYEEFKNDFGVVTQDEIDELMEAGMQWSTFKPNEGWQAPGDFIENVDVEEDGSMSIKPLKEG